MRDHGIICQCRELLQTAVSVSCEENVVLVEVDLTRPCLAAMKAPTKAKLAIFRPLNLCHNSLGGSITNS